MPEELAPQYESFISESLAAGMFPSREKVIEAGLDALREQREQLVPLIPLEHEALLKEGDADIEAGRVVDWEIVRERWRRGERLIDDELAS